MDELEKIEVAVRSAISRSMSEGFGPHWYLSDELFIPTFAHLEFMERLKKDIGHDHSKRSARQTFIQHYYEKYSEPQLPPSWMVFEVLSIGTVSKIFKGISREHQKPIAQIFDLDAVVLGSWLHALSYLRNLAAHHQRLWNRKYTIKPIIAKKVAIESSQQDRFYAQAVIIHVLLKRVSLESNWSEKLVGLFNQHPSVDIKRMGFPSDWVKSSAWR